jgi:hypothetical protein
MAENEGSVIETGNPESSEPWDQGLDDFRDTITAKGWKSNADMAKSYVELEKAVGADKVVLPAADADILKWDGWTKLGTPDDAADYPMAAPDGFEAYDASLSDDMRAAFHEARLTPAQAQHIHDKFVDRMITTTETINGDFANTQQKGETELKKEFGTAFDDRIAAAKRGINEYGGEELMVALVNAGLGSNPSVVRAFAKIGMTLKQSGQFKDAEGSGRFGTTPDAAKDQIAEIRANPALYDKAHAEYKVLNERLTRLTQTAFPGTAG